MAEFYYWSTNDAAFINAIKDGSKHFKYVTHKQPWTGRWLLLGQSKTGCSYEVMVRLGCLASQGELQKHSADYHKANGMIDKRTAAYFIDNNCVRCGEEFRGLQEQCFSTDCNERKDVR